MQEASYWIEKLGLLPHPEGGYYREIYRSSGMLNHPVNGKDRNLATSIYFLLKGEEISHFHVLQSDELWYFHDGTGAKVHLFNNGNYEHKLLGLGKEESPQALIPAQSIFAAEVIHKNSFVLMGCVVSPGFDFEDFRMVSKEELIIQYPDHANIVERFCL